MTKLKMNDFVKELANILEKYNATITANMSGDLSDVHDHSMELHIYDPNSRSWKPLESIELTNDHEISALDCHNFLKRK